MQIFRLLLLLTSLLSFHSIDSTEKKVAFVRHGTTDWNWRDFAGGIKDLPINTLGELHTKEISESLFNSCFTLPNIIIASPLLRCRQTAQIIQDYYFDELGIKIPIVIETGIQGPIYGKWTQETYQNVGELVTKIESLNLDDFVSKNLFLEKLKNILPGDEEPEEIFLLRIHNAVASIMNQYDEVIIVSHGSSSEAFLKSLNLFETIDSEYWKSKNRYPLIIKNVNGVNDAFVNYGEKTY